MKKLSLGIYNYNYPLFQVIEEEETIAYAIVRRISGLTEIQEKDNSIIPKGVDYYSYSTSSIYIGETSLHWGEDEEIEEILLDFLKEEEYLLERKKQVENSFNLFSGLAVHMGKPGQKHLPSLQGEICGSTLDSYRFFSTEPNSVGYIFKVSYAKRFKNDVWSTIDENGYRTANKDGDSDHDEVWINPSKSIFLGEIPWEEVERLRNQYSQEDLEYLLTVAEGSASFIAESISIAA